jgi:hypothetical protein
MTVPPQCEPLADEVATLRAGLPALRDAVGQARGVYEKLQARAELAAQEHAVAVKQAELDACEGRKPPPPPVAVALLGDTDVFIDIGRDGSWGGALWFEKRLAYTLVFSGYSRSTVEITTVPPPRAVGGGSVGGGPFNLVVGAYFSTVTRSGGVSGDFDQATGRIDVPLFMNFDEGVAFPGLWNTFYGYREQSQAAFLLSTEDRLPEALFNFGPLSGQRVTSDGRAVLNAIGRVSGGANDRMDLAVIISGQLFPWPLPT